MIKIFGRSESLVLVLETKQPAMIQDVPATYDDDDDANELNNSTKKVSCGCVLFTMLWGFLVIFCGYYAALETFKHTHKDDSAPMNEMQVVVVVVVPLIEIRAAVTIATQSIAI